MKSIKFTFQNKNSPTHNGGSYMKTKLPKGRSMKTSALELDKNSDNRDPKRSKIIVMFWENINKQ